MSSYKDFSAYVIRKRKFIDKYYFSVPVQIREESEYIKLLMFPLTSEQRYTANKLINETSNTENDKDYFVTMAEIIKHV